MSDLVGKPEDPFSHDTAHMSYDPYSQVLFKSMYDPLQGVEEREEMW